MAENNNNQNAQIVSTPLSKVIEQGEEVKYFIDIDQDGFDMTGDDFTVELR